MMDERTLGYRSYLLRIWRADNDGHPVWRFSLQPIGGGPPWVFGDPNALLAFLEGGDARSASTADLLGSDDG